MHYDIVVSAVQNVSTAAAAAADAAAAAAAAAADAAAAEHACPSVIALPQYHEVHLDDFDAERCSCIRPVVQFHVVCLDASQISHGGKAIVYSKFLLRNK